MHFDLFSSFPQIKLNNIFKLSFTLPHWSIQHPTMCSSTSSPRHNAIHALCNTRCSWNTISGRIFRIEISKRVFETYRRVFSSRKLRWPLFKGWTRLFFFKKTSVYRVLERPSSRRAIITSHAPRWSVLSGQVDSSG